VGEWTRRWHERSEKKYKGMEDKDRKGRIV
jgi:hypothetical protein